MMGGGYPYGQPGMGMGGGMGAPYGGMPSVPVDSRPPREKYAA